MFRNESNNSVSATMCSHSFTGYPGKGFHQYIHYDKVDEFSGTLLVTVMNNCFSFNYVYRPKDHLGDVLILSMVSDNNELTIYYSNQSGKIENSKTLCFCCTTGQEQIKNLITEMERVNQGRSNTCEYMTNDVLITRAKALLQQFAAIIRALLRADQPSLNFIKLLANVYSLEADSFQNIVAIENDNKLSNAPK